MATFNPPEENYCIKIKMDAIYPKIYFGSEKKRYVGEILAGMKEAVLDDYAIDKMIYKNRKVVGFEQKKGDTPELLKKAQEKIFDIIFEENTLEGIEKRVKEYLLTVKKLLYAGELDSELSIEKGTRKQLNEYKTKDVHVKVAEKLIEQKLFRFGDSVKFVITDVDDHGRKVGEPVIKGKELPKIKKRGYDYYFNERLLPCVERIVGKTLSLDSRTLDEWCPVTIKTAADAISRMINKKGIDEI